ncbi:MAG: helix-turn-helix domain-containing protein [bacterium]|nr:helix-turn-helix domain-containing protein [bacterium]
MIPYFRRKMRIKQYDMAKDLRVSPSYLCKVETGLQNPTERFKDLCARYLKVTVPELFPKKIDKKNIETVNTSLNNKLWNVRKGKGIKQYELAKLIGCSPSFLSKIEKGQQKPNSRFKKKCAKILKIKEAELFP